MYEGIVGIRVPRIRTVIMIWDEIFFKLRVSFYGLVRRKKVLSDSIHRIDKHIDVVVEVIEVHSSVAFGLCIDENFIEVW